ncbi:MAG: hypothetical protein IKJ77_01780 [Firmicutes bacterium]|nr:hypothetical protein [Bacillota bacterium]
MDKKWPFGFFVYNNVGDKEEPAGVEEVAKVELVKVVWAETPAAVIAEEEIEEAAEEAVPQLEEEYLPEDEPQPEDAELPDTDDEDDFDEDEDLPDLEEELEIALEEAHQKEVKKQRLITGISAGVALLGAVGLATGLAIHNHFKKK